jgi:hypothetical protein
MVATCDAGAMSGEELARVCPAGCRLPKGNSNQKICEQKLRRIASKYLVQRSNIESKKVTVELDDGAREDQTC